MGVTRYNSAGNCFPVVQANCWDKIWFDRTMTNCGRTPWNTFFPQLRLEVFTCSVISNPIMYCTGTAIEFITWTLHMGKGILGHRGYRHSKLQFLLSLRCKTAKWTFCDWEIKAGATDLTNVLQCCLVIDTCNSRSRMGRMVLSC